MQRIERRNYLQADFQECLDPSEGLDLQNNLDNREGPYLHNRTEPSLYFPFILVGPMSVGMVQQPLIVYRYWDGMRHQVLLNYPCMVFIPMVSTGLYFMEPSFVIHIFRPPGSSSTLLSD